MIRRQRQLTINGNRQLKDRIPVLGKRLGVMLMCGMLFCGAGTGCATAKEKTAKTEETTKEEIQDMESAKSGVSGRIAVSSREEKEAADQTVQKLFGALENRDETAIRSLFSPYALENAADLDGSIRELIAYYPGADGGYEGVTISTEDKDGGKVLHVLDITLTVTDKGQEYQINICLQMRNDFDPSMEGVHLIEAIREEEKKAGFKWKEKEDEPGIYVGE